MDTRAHRPLRSYGRKKGHRLSPRQQRLFDELLPRLRVDIAMPSPASVAGLFPNVADKVALEIGFGAGEHLLWHARQAPRWGFIGCEPFLNGIAAILGRIEDTGTANIRLHDGDVRDLLEWLPDACFDRVFILFPDPWPKKRHAKRRLVSTAFLRGLARAMKPGAELRFASDIPEYAAGALIAARDSGAFEWTARSARDWRERLPDWPQTRYEAKALAEGRKSTYLTFLRGP
ncbi:MAG: tRNA (guanine(46)-N(7))-methyltransferase TrmB [Pseudomonadota bacterium]|nr:tRNA (guanine(46)-N(7))-methyltransferase TrmB [Pseudomonadota bacterium]